MKERPPKWARLSVGRQPCAPCSGLGVHSPTRHWAFTVGLSRKPPGRPVLDVRAADFTAGCARSSRAVSVGHTRRRDGWPWRVCAGGTRERDLLSTLWRVLVGTPAASWLLFLRRAGVTGGRKASPLSRRAPGTWTWLAQTTGWQSPRCLSQESPIPQGLPVTAGVAGFQGPCPAAAVCPDPCPGSPTRAALGAEGQGVLMFRSPLSCVSAQRSPVLWASSESGSMSSRKMFSGRLPVAVIVPFPVMVVETHREVQQ